MKHLLPSQLYQQAIAANEIQSNAQQRQVLKHLDRIQLDLIKRQQQRHSHYGKLRRKIKPRKAIQGLYLWGSVGRGKTYLMDLFYENLPVPKLRQHFHVFMRDLHQKLTQMQGHKNPLEKIAKEISDQYLTICFDEFFVSNIADAMLLGTLFKTLFKHGLTLVATSNIPPQKLYQDGIQRQQFLPTIKLLQQQCTILHLETDTDYRLRHLHNKGVYYTPLDIQAEHGLEICFDHFSNKAHISTSPITICNRTIEIKQTAEKVIWFDFSKLCSPPRSQQDYLALCQQFDYFILSNVPIITERNTSQATLFINLIDVLYDQHAILALSAATTLENLYPKGRLTFEFRRTQSRLIEMNSEDYFAKQC
jgi:cell division protein ZapE